MRLRFWWYNREQRKTQTPPPVWPEVARLQEERKAELERRTGKSFERLRSEASHWLRTDQVPDYIVYGFAWLSPRIREIVEAEVLLGNTVGEIGSDQTRNEISRVVVTLREAFRCQTLSLPRGERWGWEHFYVDPESGHEVRALFHRSSATTPVLCEHLREVEIAMHRAGIRLISQFGNQHGKWLRFYCDLDLEATQQQYRLSEFIHLFEEEHEVGPEWYTERRMYCSLCGCGIEEAGGPQKFPG